MSNFGADIFDEEPSSPPSQSKRTSKPSRAPEDPSGGEVSLTSDALAKTDEDPEVSFGATRPTEIPRGRQDARSRGAERQEEGEAPEKKEAGASEDADAPRVRRGRGRGDRGRPGERQEREGANREERTDREERPDQEERTDREERAERPPREHGGARGENRDRGRGRGRGERGDRGGRSDRGEKGDRGDSQGRSGGRGRSRRSPRRDDARRGEGGRDRPAPGPTSSSPASGTTAAGQRVAVFIDVTALEEQARNQGGEISYRRLVRNLVGTRPLIRAVAYVDSVKTPDAGQISASGFEVETIGEGAEAALMVAVDTMGIAPRVDCVVLAPHNPRLEHLAKTLRSQGLRVETAGFNPEEEAAGSHRALGRDSMFVP